MNSFDFGKEVLKTILEELAIADEYIRIAVFQIHNQDIFNLLSKKNREGIKIEIFTLPYNSINPEIRNRVKNQLIQLEQEGIKLHFCKWNIGDPGRTTTATGRWYSFHGKFIVTDKSAISLSANLTESIELDAVLTFRNDPEKISKYNEKFEQLLRMFVVPTDGFDGTIRKSILNSNFNDPLSLFILPNIIESETHVNNWIRDYPSELCLKNVGLSENLYICPFDIRGRDAIIQIINDAEKYLYISTESFTDPDIINTLIEAKLEGIDIKILTGTTSMDFSDRIQKTTRNLLAAGINIKTISGLIHAKLIITDKLLAVSSINLNKINLGFSKRSNLWRENTETITISYNSDLIIEAKEKFDNIFLSSIDIKEVLASKIEKDVKVIFLQYYGLKSRNEVKKLFSKYIVNQDINSRRTAIQIGKITKSLMTTFSRNIVEIDDFIMAIILHLLSDNKLKFDQLYQNLTTIYQPNNLENLLSTLTAHSLIEKQDDYYKLKVLSLF
jgi:phosphatidylserine/phosphatidylglycerophosphate/cardiolipin synthase-like enzyme